MLYSAGIFADYFEEFGCDLVKTPSDFDRKFVSARIYYPGAAPDADCLYLIDASACAQIDGTPSAAFCLVTDQPEADERFEFVLGTDMGVAEVFARLLEKMEALNRWDSALSEILLRDGSLQELLDCSVVVFDAPCFLQDSNFYLLASSGAVAEEENPFFYETLRTGRAPSGLFTQLLSRNPSEQPYASPRAISSAVKELSDQKVLIADCCVDGVAALHFCLYYGAHRRRGLSHMIIHLMQRMEAGPSIRLLASKSTDLHDELFCKIIDAPEDGEFTNICSVLGLLRYERFTAVCIESDTSNVDRVMTRLRALYPRFWFFRYQTKLFALLGSSQESRAADLTAREDLLQRLGRLSLQYGCSLDHFTAKTLKLACRQAAETLSLSENAADYQSVMVQHMLGSFFTEHSFAWYCPESFRQMLQEDDNSPNNNLTLLDTFLSNNCNATAVSRILHMHRNNVLYRIEKIKAKYHFDLSDGSERLLLQMLAKKAIMDRAANGGKK